MERHPRRHPDSFDVLIRQTSALELVSFTGDGDITMTAERSPPRRAQRIHVGKRVSEGGLEPSAPKILVERESGQNRGFACGVRENERPDADRCSRLPRIGATTGGHG
jgi:hypothetical protein